MTVHLPAQHTDDDLALASALADHLRSGELYVTWSSTVGRAYPVIPAALAPVRRGRGRPTVGSLVDRLRNRRGVVRRRGSRA